ncbi:MAG: hypothetical protein HQ581_04065 [Planctomycetes bacterium]|nr:hypothetical protein [Planctomycetota bacterium]
MAKLASEATRKTTSPAMIAAGRLWNMPRCVVMRVEHVRNAEPGHEISRDNRQADRRQRQLQSRQMIDQQYGHHRGDQRQQPATGDTRSDVQVGQHAGQSTHPPSQRTGSRRHAMNHVCRSGVAGPQGRADTEMGLESSHQRCLLSEPVAQAKVKIGAARRCRKVAKHSFSQERASPRPIFRIYSREMGQGKVRYG